MEKLKRIFKKMISVVKDNVLLVGLVLTGVLNDFILRGLTVGGLTKIKPIITSMGVVLLLSVVIVLLFNKKHKYMYVLASGVLALLSAVNYLYFTHYNSFISIGVFNQTKHLSEMKNSVRETLNIKVLLFIIPSLILYFVYKKLKKENFAQQKEDQYSSKLQVLSPILLGIALLLAVSTTLTGTDISRLQKQWNREYLVEQFGIYSFATADLIKMTSVPKAINADFDDFVLDIEVLVNENKSQDLDNRYTNALEGKDVYVIHYESVQNFAMDLAFEDGPVTPFLNKLSEESLFFENFYPQHSVGTSSDSEFTFATSLYPINNGTVFIDHADKEFQTIQKLLLEKGYHTMSMHGNNGSFWNRNIMHPNLGYNEFLEKEDYVIDEEVGLGLSDASFYRQSVDMIKDRKETLDQPMMAKIISLSHHYPFDDLETYGEFDTGFLEGTDISNYLKSLNYADQSLEAFFAQMDEEGLLDNAAIVIYGDHHAKISKKDYEFLYNYDEETETSVDKLDEDYITMNNAYLKQVRKTPLLIWTKDGSLQERIEEPIGMINVMPTLGNMLNVNNPYRLGQDIFNVTDNTVIYPDGSFITKDHYYSASSLNLYDNKTNELLLDYVDFSEELLKEIGSVEKDLELSSDMIINDLIKLHKNYLD